MRAISKNTRKVTALTLAAALVVAVYLNWQYARAGVTLEENAVQVAAGADTADEASAPILEGGSRFQRQQELWRSTARQRSESQRFQVF